jgi:hypothetical protein
LPHLTSALISCRAPPHTPKGVVVRQLHRPTCPTSAPPEVRQVRQPKARGPRLLVIPLPNRYSPSQICSTASQCRPGLVAGLSERVLQLARYRRPLSSWTNPRPSDWLCAGPTFPCASQPASRRVYPQHNPLCRNETHRCHHLSRDQKGIYARVSNHVFHSVGTVAHACDGQSIRATQALALPRPRYSKGMANRPGVVVPGPQISLGFGIIDGLIPHTAAPQSDHASHRSAFGVGHE